MKVITKTAAVLALTISACSNNKADQQKQMDDVMTVHDKVMGYDETAVRNKSQLDSLAKLPAFAPQKDSLQALSQNLAAADSAMGEWMNKFNPDFKGKSDDEVKAYLNAEKKTIMKIDTQFSRAIEQSNQYLSIIGNKK